MIFVALGKKNGNSKEIDVAPVLCLLYGNKQVEIKSHNLSINLLSFLSMPTFGSFTRNSYIQVIRNRERESRPPPQAVCSWSRDGVPDRVISTSLGPLHDWHPLVIVAEERQIKVGATTVRLGADGELTQQPAYCLCVPSILGIYNSVFKPKIKHQWGRLC